MSHVSGELHLRVKRPLRPIPEMDFGKLTCEAAAIRYSVDNSGLQDKSLAYETGTDPGTFSKAKAGQARLNDDALDALMDATGIEAPLYAWLLRRGYDPRSLRKLETETERALREAHELLDAERLKVRVLTEAFTGRKG